MYIENVLTHQAPRDSAFPSANLIMAAVEQELSAARLIQPKQQVVEEEQEDTAVLVNGEAEDEKDKESTATKKKKKKKKKSKSAHTGDG